MLRKDFTVDPYQVWQARALGAGAVLLIARALSDDELRAGLAASGEAGIDALVEVHTATELERALRLDATLVGVNARDLDSLAVDRDATLGLIAAARAAGATVVAESGLSEPAHLAAVAAAGAHAALIGTALLAANDPAARLAELTTTPARSAPRVPPHPARVLVKTCGLRNEAGVRAAVAADADFAGFVTTADSPRRVEVREAARLAAGLGTIPPVLVFRAPDAAEIDRAAASFADILGRQPGIQLAGFEGPPPWLAERANRHPVVLGIVHQPHSVRAALCSAEAWYAAGATHLLLEGASAARGGGSGAGAPLEVARRLNRIVPAGVAGGLDPAGVASAVRDARPALVDAASGLERNHASDPRRIAAFVRAARREPTGADRVDARGRFGPFGGRYVPETLIPPLDELSRRMDAGATRPAPTGRSWPGCSATSSAARRRCSRSRPRPSPTAPGPTSASSSSARTSRTPAPTRSTTPSARVCWRSGWARRGSWPRPAPVSTGWRPPPPARCSASTCVVYMGTTDVERQAPNVRRMHLLGAEVRPVATGHGTLRDALNEALRDWVANVDRHRLHPRLGGRPAPVPGHGRRAPVASSGARLERSCSSASVASLTSRSRRSAVAATRSACSGRSSTRAPGSSASRPAAGETGWATTPRRWAWARPASCTGPSRCSPRPRRARSSSRTRYPPASTIPASAPSCRRWPPSAAWRSSAPPTPMRSPRSTA